MSVATWKKEFFGKIKDNMTDKECAEHTVKKYTGTLKENLIKHDVTKLKKEAYIEDKRNKDFCFDTETCSFCKKYYIRNFYTHECKKCPLYIEEGVNCFSYDSSYAKFINSSNPNKLISLMKKIIKKCDETGVYENKKRK